MLKCRFFLFACSAGSLLPASTAPLFSGCRLGAQIGLTRNYVYPEESAPIAFFGPRISAHINAGNITKNAVYYGVHVFGGRLHGKTVSHAWAVAPRFDCGIGAVVGAIVETSFLTSLEFGLRKNYFRIKAPQEKFFVKEDTTMAFIGFNTESTLSESVSSEVSYHYGLALRPTEPEAHFRYTKRASTHTFALGLLVRL